MIIRTQFSVFLVNKPGVLAQVLDELGDAKVNITALSVSDSSEHGVLRLVAEDADAVRAVLTRVNVPTTETSVLEVPVGNRPGAVAGLCDRLAGRHINIAYAYCTSGAPGNRTYCILKVADPKKAMKVLSDKTLRRKRPKATTRRPRATVR